MVLYIHVPSQARPVPVPAEHGREEAWYKQHARQMDRVSGISADGDGDGRTGAGHRLVLHPFSFSANDRVQERKRRSKTGGWGRTSEGMMLARTVEK